MRGTTAGCPERCQQGVISIHVPREGHDLAAGLVHGHAGAFLSTCPVRGTTVLYRARKGAKGISIHVPREGHDGTTVYVTSSGSISIHVPREGHDWMMSQACFSSLYFYPRAP